MTIPNPPKFTDLTDSAKYISLNAAVCCYTILNVPLIFTDISLGSIFTSSLFLYSSTDWAMYYFFPFLFSCFLFFFLSVTLWLLLSFFSLFLPFSLCFFLSFFVSFFLLSTSISLNCFFCIQRSLHFKTTLSARKIWSIGGGLNMEGY